jgi:hypothetical protein
MDERAQRRAGEVAVFVVDRLDAGSVDRQQLAAIEVEPSAQQHELAEDGAKLQRFDVGKQLHCGIEEKTHSDNGGWPNGRNGRK